MENQIQNKRIWLGVIFVSIGLFLILRNLGLMPFYIPSYIFSWKSFLILMGLFFWFAKQKRETGIILMVIGGFFLLQDIAFFSFYDIIDFWPLVFVAIGVAIILRRQGPHSSIDTGTDSMDHIDEIAIFSGADRYITSQNFRGGKITTIFGGADINLTGARLSPQVNVIDVFTLFGGSEIIVPRGWNVKVQVTAIFGAFDDSRDAGLNVEEPVEGELVIKGFVLFGGGELKAR